MSGKRVAKETDRLETLYEVLDILREAKITPCLIGHTGVGKTEIISQYVISRNLDPMENVRVGQMETGAELTGIPQVRDDLTQYFPLKRLKTAKTVFFDEINRVRSYDVLQAVFEPILDGRIGELDLSEAFIITAMNPETDEYNVVPIDEAFIDRLCFIEIENNIDMFVEYLTGQDYDLRASALTASFLNKAPEQFHPRAETKYDLPRQAPTPRSWEKFTKCVSTRPDMTQAARKLIARGLLGPAVSNAIEITMNLPTIEELQKKPWDALKIQLDILEKIDLVPLSGQLYVLMTSKMLGPARGHELIMYLFDRAKDLTIGLLKRILRGKRQVPKPVMEALANPALAAYFEELREYTKEMGT